MFIVYIERSHVIITTILVLLSLKIEFVIANHADTCVMPHIVSIYLSLHCLSKYLFSSFWSPKDYNDDIYFSDNLGVIIGVGVGVPVFLLLVIIFVSVGIYIRRKDNRRHRKYEDR